MTPLETVKIYMYNNKGGTVGEILMVLKNV